MTDLIELLRQFNRKERYFLIRQALGVEEFQLSDEFRKKLGRKLGIEILPDVSVWMDYHLDWVAASVAAYCRESLDVIFPNSGDDKVVMATNQDIDFLGAVLI